MAFALNSNFSDESIMCMSKWVDVCAILIESVCSVCWYPLRGDIDMKVKLKSYNYTTLELFFSTLSFFPLSLSLSHGSTFDISISNWIIAELMHIGLNKERNTNTHTE